jgi:Mg-chelatase subunit ChlD
LLLSLGLAAQDLSIGPGDVRIIQSPEGGYHLYIRKKPGVSSVILTETTKDPAMKESNYAYRALEYNPINGDEKRLLNGEFISPEKKIWSLIDSTPEVDTPLGEAFHVWIPYVIAYGYDWSRNGETQVLDGTFINIRAFSKPFGDYSGAFADNPFKMRVTQKAIVRADPPKGEIFMKETVSTFAEMAEKSSGKTLYATGPSDIVPMVSGLLVGGERGLDLVFVLDATESMKDDIVMVREELVPSLERVLGLYPDSRVALVLYKDYFEDFLVKIACSFTRDLVAFRKSLGSFRVQGGRDIPEAVYEGIDGALRLPWTPGWDRKIILIGDAPPHPRPRGKITKEAVDRYAAAQNVEVNVIILPHGETM